MRSLTNESTLFLYYLIDKYCGKEKKPHVVVVISINVDFSRHNKQIIQYTAKGSKTVIGAQCQYSQLAN